MSRRLPRLSLRIVVAAALLSCLVSALPFPSQVHAATQPVLTGVIPPNQHLTLGNATFIGSPGYTITVGPNGVITVSGSGAVHVIPDRGYVLARFNPTTGQWEAVRNNTILPGTGTYALVSGNRVPHITSSRVQLGRVSGGRTAACKAPRNATGPVPSGCQLLNITAPARSRLSVTVSYAGVRKTQHFVGTVDAHGHYRGAFPVTYNPPARNKRGVTVTVTVVSTLPDGAYGGTTTIKFVVTPRKRP